MRLTGLVKNSTECGTKMKILSEKFPGSIHICKECGALLAYQASDIEHKKFIICPICYCRQEVKMNLEYEQ